MDPDFSVARAELEQRLANAEGPTGLLPLSLAQVSFKQDDHPAVVRYAGLAIYQCLLIGNVSCELQARRFKSFSMDTSGDYAGAIWEAEKAFELSRLLGLHADQVKAASSLARHRLIGLNNIPRALQVLELSAELVDRVDLVSQLFFDHWRGRAAQRLGHSEQALLALHRVARKAPGSLVEGLGEASLVDALGIELRQATTPGERQRIIHLLETMSKNPNTDPQVQIRAVMIRHAHIPGSNALAELTHCAQTARELANDEIALACETQLAILLAPTDPDAAQRWLDIAGAALASGSTLEMDLLLARAQLRTLWSLPITNQTVPESLDLLAIIERAKNLQRVGDRATEFLGFLNDDHYWLADQLMAAISRGDLQQRQITTALGILSSARKGRAASELEAHASMVALRQWTTWRDRLRTLHSAAELTLETFTLAEQAIETAAIAEPEFSVALTLDPGPADTHTLVFFQWHHEPSFERRAYVINWPQIYSVTLDPDKQANELLNLLESSVRSGDEERLNYALTGLSQAIIQPLTLALADNERPLVLLPDGQLHGVPLAALPGADRRITQAQVFGSLQSWVEARREPSSRTLQPAAVTLTIFAAPDLPESPLPATTLAANPLDLPATLIEARAIEQRWPESETYTGQYASESAAVAALLSSSSWVHFAAHVKIQPDLPLMSSLQLASDSTNDGWLTVKEISELQIPSKVVVLSACESGAGRRLTGEGLIGLSTALLDAGASSVVANLWPVDDAMAASFISRWYARLEQGQTLATAMTDTREEFAAAGHPASVWAGWTLLGDTRLGLPADAGRHRSAKWVVTAGAIGIMLVLLALLAFFNRIAGRND